MYSARKNNLSNDLEGYNKPDFQFSQRRSLHTPMAYRLDNEIFPQKLFTQKQWVSLHREAVLKEGGET